MALDPETFVQLRDSVRRFVRERLVPHEAEVGESNEIPESLLKEMREISFLSSNGRLKTASVRNLLSRKEKEARPSGRPSTAKAVMSPW